MMPALPGPQPRGGMSGRLRLLLTLAVLVALALAFWPSPDELVVEALPQRSSMALQRSAPIVSEAAAGLVLAVRDVQVPHANLFARHSWYRPPPPPPVREIVPAAPTAPPFPYSYLGQYARGADKPVYILQRDDNVFDVQIGQVLDGVWHVDEVAQGRMQLTYVPLQLKQVLPVGSPQ